jgi:sRNA-binding protein
MTITKEDIHAALARLAEWFPQTFVLEKHLPHRPLKVGIHPDILARCPALTRREANNLQQSWRFDWEPPKAVLRDVRTIDWIWGG